MTTPLQWPACVCVMHVCLCILHVCLRVMHVCLRVMHVCLSVCMCTPTQTAGNTNTHTQAT